MTDKKNVEITEKLGFLLGEMDKIKKYCKRENVNMHIDIIFIDDGNVLKIDWDNITTYTKMMTKEFFEKPLTEKEKR